jgi:ABC-2 type transport system ATP-binding protein
MSDLLEPANSGGRGRPLTASFLANRTESPEPLRAAQDLPQYRSEPVALFDRVSKWYGDVIGVNEVTFEVLPGITGLVGPNGAGKSTIMKLATGQLRPSLGEVRIQGVTAWRAAAKRHLGYCPESDAFYEEMSGREFVVCMARLFGFPRSEAEDRAEHTLQRVGMAERADRRLRGYSKGMRQRIKLAQAIVHDPQLLILDEPLNGIDPVGRIELNALFRELAEQGKAILISSHQLEELERLTSRIMVVARGRMLAQGTVTEIRDLFEDQPLSVRIDCDRPRELAAALLQLPDVLGVDLGGPGTVVARARQPHRFFKALGTLIIEDDYDIKHLETLDCSTQAILDYLLKGMT